MKWMFVFCLSPFVTFSPFAMYNGNPSQPDMPELGLWISNDTWWGLKLGYEWDSTFEKSIKICEKNSGENDRLDTYNTIKNIGTLTFNVADRFEVYGILGTMNLKLTERPVDNIRLQYQADSQFIWGLGGRIILVYWEEMIMGVNAVFSKSDLEFDHFIENGREYPNNTGQLKYYEWQLGVTFSKEIGPMIPYIGLAYSSMQSNLYNKAGFRSFGINNSFVKEKRIKNKEPFILVLGIGLSEERVMSINLESRLIGEKALTFSGNIRF